MSINLNQLSKAANLKGGGGKASGGCSAVTGFVRGLIFIPLSILVVYYGEVMLVNHGKVFARIAMVSVEEAAASNAGLVKFQGTPVGEFLEVEKYDKPVVFWRKTYEEYVEEKDEDGSTYSWRTDTTQQDWAEFKIGSIKIVGDQANPVGTREVFKGLKGSLDSDFKADKINKSPEVGDERLTIKVIDVDENLIVMGEVSGEVCRSGSSFVISALNEAATEDTLRREYKIMYWLVKGGAILLLWSGLVGLFAPLMALVGWIPWLGNKMTGALSSVLFVVALVFVAVATVAIKMFWVVVGLLLAGLVVLVVYAVKSSRQRPSASAALADSGLPSGPPAGYPAAPPATPPIAPPAMPPATPPAAPPAAPSAPPPTAPVDTPIIPTVVSPDAPPVTPPDASPAAPPAPPPAAPPASPPAAPPETPPGAPPPPAPPSA